MFSGELERFEGVWVGTERVSEGGTQYEASARLVFQAVFDGRFLVCDYIQTVPHRPTSVAHGVFRNDDRTNKLTVTWFRSPVATATQQADAVAEGDKPVFVETIAGRTTRTTYSALRDRLSIRTECSLGGDEWKLILEGSYRRR
jgi:hypothetical protein